MNALTTVGWLLLAVAVTFWVVWQRAAAEIRRVRAEERAMADHWKGVAERARIRAYQLKMQIDAYRAGHAQGRDDSMRAMRQMAATYSPAEAGRRDAESEADR